MIVVSVLWPEGGRVVVNTSSPSTAIVYGVFVTVLEVVPSVLKAEGDTSVVVSSSPSTDIGPVEEVPDTVDTDSEVGFPVSSIVFLLLVVTTIVFE